MPIYNQLQRAVAKIVKLLKQIFKKYRCNTAFYAD